MCYKRSREHSCLPLRGFSGFNVLLDKRWRYVGTTVESLDEIWPVVGREEVDWFISGFNPVADVSSAARRSARECQQRLLFYEGSYFPQPSWMIALFD